MKIFLNSKFKISSIFLHISNWFKKNKKTRKTLSGIIFILIAFQAYDGFLFFKMGKACSRTIIKMSIHESSHINANEIEIYKISLNRNSYLVNKSVYKKSASWDFRNGWWQKAFIQLKKNAWNNIKNISINISKKSFTFTSSDIQKWNRTPDPDTGTYRIQLPEFIKDKPSILPVFSRLKNWPGDLQTAKKTSFRFAIGLVQSLFFLILCFFTIAILYTFIKKIWQNHKTRKFYFINFSVLFISEIIFLLLFLIKNSFSLLDPFFLVFSFFKITCDWFFYLLIISLFYRIVRNIIIPILFTSFYLILIWVDTAIYYYGFTRLEKSHLSLITPYSIKGFINTKFLVFTAFFLMICSIANWSVSKLKNDTSWKKVFQLLFLIMFLTFTGIPELIINEKIRSFRKNNQELRPYLMSVKKNQLMYMKENSFVRFFREIFINKKKAVFNKTNDFSDFSSIIKKFGLPLGSRKYKKLHIEKPDKIIVLATESLSLDFLSANNRQLNIKTTDFYDSPEIQKKMFKNYKTTSHNTLQGLSVMFHSHPNFLIGTQASRDFSLVEILRKDGYKTIFLRSASKFFASENIIFKKFGFQKTIGLEDFKNEKNLKKYIYDWGLCDRILYQKLIELLEKHKHEKLFITVLGVDTHPLYGRMDYRDLKYPEIPKKFNKLGDGGKYLKSVYCHDYDVGKMIKLMKKMGLLDNRTLLILTADHACPYNNVIEQIPGYEATNLAKIPLCFLSNQDIPVNNKDILSSQLDFAPSVLHLLNLPIPDGYWGESLFSSYKKNQFIGVDKGILTIENPPASYQINLTQQNTLFEEKIVLLFKSIFRPAPAASIRQKQNPLSDMRHPD